MEIRRYWLFLVLILSLLFLLFLLARIFASALCRILSRKYGIRVEIKKIGFLSVQGIYIFLDNGTTLEVDKIWLRCKLFHSDSRSFFVICLNDIRLQGDAFWIGSSTRHKSSNTKKKRPIRFPFQGLKLFSFQAYNVSVMQLGLPQEEFLLHVSLKEFVLFCEDCLYGVSLNSSITASSLKVFKHFSTDPEAARAESCLGHLSANVHVQVKVSFNQKELVQCFSLSIVQPELILYEGFSVSQFKKQVSAARHPTNELVSDADTHSVEDQDCGTEEKDSTESARNILEKFPENTSFNVDSFSIKLMREGGHRAITLDMKSIDAQLNRNNEFEDFNLLSMSSSFSIQELVAASSHIQFAQLERAAVKLEVGNRLLASTVQLSSFMFSYDKEVLQCCLDVITFGSPKDSSVPKVKTSNPKLSFNALKLFEGMHFRNTIELDNICISTKFPGCNAFSIGLTHWNSKLADKLILSAGGDVCLPYQRYTFFERLSLELLLESAYFKIGGDLLSDNAALKRCHFWNVPISIGMILLKTKFHHDDYTAECMMDSIQVEWSPTLATLICELRKYTKALSSSSRTDSSLKSSNRKLFRDFSKKNWSVILNITALNMFCVTELKTAILMRMDSINVDYRLSKIKVFFEGSKLATISLTALVHSCVKSSEMRPFVANISKAAVIHDFSKQETSLEFSEDVSTFWSTGFHMLVMTVIEDIKAFKAELMPQNRTEASISVRHKGETDRHFFIKLQGKIKIGLILSSSHSVEFSSPEVTVTFSQTVKSAQTEFIAVIFDGHEVFSFKNILLTLAPGTEQHLYIRKNFDNLEQPNNRLLNVHVEEFKVAFPYEYNFSEAFSEKFLGTIKWLKRLHKPKKTEFTLESILPPDVSIKTKLWRIELEDDPFEVKLRDNFRLLEDEYHESLKRRRVLDEKIENLKKSRPLLPGEKVNQLYFNLSRKNADIYIMRSRQLYQRGPTRASLFTYQLEDIEVLAVADSSYHGTERVVNHMKIIDPESPFPEEGIEFNTLWGRKVRCSTSSWTCNLRDFPQPLLMIKGLYVWGFLVGAEQEGPPRAKRTTVVDIGEPWGSSTVERNMPALKFYHDLTFDMEDLCMSYGPCWEPVMAAYGLAMDYVSRPSLDPSPVLPWWDKMRLLYHGRLIFSIQHLTLLMRASLDPYNNTEQMELTWSDVIIEWTTGKILTKGDLDVYVHTASKYDDCRVLHIPNLKLSISMDWVCLGNPFDHHNAIPCAPDKIPEYSINQEHDSYRAFRSQNMNISYSYETKNVNAESDDLPSMLLFSSTLRWIENLKMILSGVTRLTRRGKLFGNTKPRKPQLSRHYRSVRVSLNLQKFQIFYWMSFAKRQGLELVGGRLDLSCENTLSFIPATDGLKHRPIASWGIAYLTCALCDSEMSLYNWVQVDTNESTAESFHAPVERSYFLSVNRVSYAREEIVKDVVSDEDKPDTPTHRLVVHGLKGAWTKHNRTVIFSLYDSYMKNIVVKKNLSTEALRGFKVETQNTPQKHRASITNAQTNTMSPVSHLQSGHAISMLQKLIAEAEANPMVFTEELEASTREQLLHGVAACQTDDVLQKKWLIELVNSQVMLKGCETSGYVIVSAAKAQILQRIHRPVWKDRSLVSKTTWVGSFECMQYYATVDVGDPGPSVDNIMWLSVDNIDGREFMVISDLPDMVGSGHSVGGVVSNTVGPASDPGSGTVQLQRIVSRCGCQFFCANFGENVDPSSLEEVPPLLEEIDLWEREVAVDSFTLTHHDLEICTNSLQYAMILDLVNNLLLYVEPRKKEAIERLQYMRFQMQLRSVDDQKKPILQLQEKLRSLVSTLRRLEKEAYVTHRILCEHPEKKEEYLEKLQRLENSLYNCKEKLNSMNEELTIMICCFKETQIIANKSRQRTTSQDKGTTVARRAEVCFKHAQWRLTDPDGQLGIADIVLSNFLYSKVTKVDDSVEHLLEIGYIKVTNLLPNQVYKHVLEPTDITTSIPLDRQCMLRIYCRERAPVGGISVKEHLELNVIPFTIGVTDAFYKAMLKFFFPGRDTDKDDHQEEQAATFPRRKRQIIHRGSSTFYRDREDIEKMKERADKNHTFFYIKIPEVPLRVSYQGKKEKNIEDVRNLNLVLSTLEYHNKTWTWLDLLMELKNDAKRILLSQAIRQKILKPKGGTPRKDAEPQGEEKASILFGPRHLNAPERSSKRRIFSRPKKEQN